MKYAVLTVVVCAGFAFQVSAEKAKTPDPIPNPNIDFDGYLKVAKEAADHRASRRLTEDDFIRMSAEPGTIVLDARSKEMFDLLHIKGAVNLSFPNIDVDSLKQLLPDKNARILIYCNNNFLDTSGPFPTVKQGQPGGAIETPERPFRTKAPAASLNISTYIALYNYGYRNIYELGPRIDPAKSRLTFESNVTKAK